MSVKEINVTKKSTKDQIWEALQEAEARVAELESIKLDPKKETEVKKAVATIEKAEQIATGGVKDIIANISEQVAKALAGVADNIEGGVAEFEEVKAAIEIKKNELKELYGVEEALLNLATVVNSQNGMRVKYEEEYAAAKAKAQAELDELTAQIKTTEAAFRSRIKEEEAAIKASRSNEQAEYDYNLKRTRKIADDQWEDEMSAKRKALDNEIEKKTCELEEVEKDILRRQNEVAVREQKIDTLEEQVAGIPALVTAATEKAYAEAEASAKKSYSFETMMLKKDNEGKVALLENKISTLEANASRDAATITDLQNKLDAAYAEMKDMATKSIEGASNNKAYTAIEGVLKDMQKNGGK